VVATALSAAVWYLTRADTLSLQRGADAAFRVTGGAWPATTAFTLTFVAMGLVPAILAPWMLGRDPRTLGLGLGDTRWILRLLAIGIPVAVAAGYVGSRTPLMGAVYPLGGALTADPLAFAAHAGGYLLYYLGFEYLFRGFLLLGTKDEIGPTAANLLQACLVTAFHFGKPGPEMASAFVASVLFGWATLRTGSIWCALSVHWVVGISLDWFLVSGR
jgi:membrane protease YdiL (CAAX protease family)